MKEEKYNAVVVYLSKLTDSFRNTRGVIPKRSMGTFRSTIDKYLLYKFQSRDITSAEMEDLQTQTYKEGGLCKELPMNSPYDSVYSSPLY